MKELMKKLYVKKYNGKGIDDKTWYVPHQGVINPNKGEIRVVF